MQNSPNIEMLPATCEADRAEAVAPPALVPAVGLVVARGQRGMTLIEIMVVIVIIGVLGSALAVGVIGMFRDAQEDTAKTQIHTVGGVIEAHEARHGEFPESLASLTEGKRAKLKQANLKDAWRQELQYSTTGEGFSLCSNGPDKKPGTDDDICYGSGEN